MSQQLYGAAPYDPGGIGAAIDEQAADAGDPLELAKRGIRLREEQDYDRAEAIFQYLIEQFPELVYGWQELAVLRRCQRREQDALALLRSACDVQPDDFLTRKHLCYQLARLGLKGQARATFAAHPGPAALDHAGGRIFLNLLEFTADHGEADIIGLLAAFTRRQPTLMQEDVAARIEAALADGSPLSLIRLGDGEGAWLHVDDADEQRFAELYEANRREMLKVWFGTDALYGRPGFMALAGRLGQVLRRADLIGLPYSRRIEHEYEIASVRGIPSIANIFRAMAPLHQSQGREWRGEFCENDVHLELHLSGALQTLLSGPHPVGIISCHADLGMRLVTAYGTKVTCQLIVPEEKSFSQVEGVSGMRLSHFPMMYYRTIARLERDAASARIWLVAAGFLGKFYCDEIRARGGIALDIGSVADGWSGCLTRPTMRELDRFMLPVPR